jgi:hypothetical protein
MITREGNFAGKEGTGVLLEEVIVRIAPLRKARARLRMVVPCRP